jgi:hypothetical protein
MQQYLTLEAGGFPTDKALIPHRTEPPAARGLIVMSVLIIAVKKLLK